MISILLLSALLGTSAPASLSTDVPDMRGKTVRELVAWLESHDVGYVPVKVGGVDVSTADMKQEISVQESGPDGGKIGEAIPERSSMTSGWYISVVLISTPKSLDQWILGILIGLVVITVAGLAMTQLQLRQIKDEVSRRSP